MKLLTLNCHSWQEDKQWEKIRDIAKAIHENQYDVIALQEVSQSIDPNIEAKNFASVLLEELQQLGTSEYEYVWDFAHIGYDVYEEGLAILTKHPIIDQSSFFVSRSEDTSYWKTRKIVGVTIEYKGKPISFYSCHLGWWEDEEEPFMYQADRLLAHVQQNGIFYLMGDFNNNAFIRSEGYDYLLEKGLYDTFALAKEKDSGITVKGKIAGWDENKADLRLDLILTNKPVAIERSTVIFNGNNRPIVSDHYGVEVVITD
ncbi:endonuclease/exonuclease/phosphatase family protein [Ectobacillus antri]|jgi:maltose 6'-phosphate phosphatase|uniref:Endonuclease/exonuclease/phosphatase family protein n=1 Tax=Ectobacillus antri TaxID=2486280 RepID=A0ABT6H712_9BACI|nr:endonuclease/exonuclease/phosphatase family protein [Ectobacillus antri]MDG4657612.1 endonuclease/exonuclease/phosphatase family protein [Ectobacillus antri]MDG5755132.1 endonuclease/exonuclease/phosphatase family protein [Ectobacillus antri]